MVRFSMLLFLECLPKSVVLSSVELRVHRLIGNGQEEGQAGELILSIREK